MRARADLALKESQAETLRLVKASEKIKKEMGIAAGQHLELQTRTTREKKSSSAALAKEGSARTAATEARDAAVRERDAALLSAAQAQRALVVQQDTAAAAASTAATSAAADSASAVEAARTAFVAEAAAAEAAQRLALSPSVRGADTLAKHLQFLLYFQGLLKRAGFSEDAPALVLVEFLASMRGTPAQAAITQTVLVYSGRARGMVQCCAELPSSLSREVMSGLAQLSSLQAIISAWPSPADI